MGTDCQGTHFKVSTLTLWIQFTAGEGGSYFAIIECLVSEEENKLKRQALVNLATNYIYMVTLALLLHYNLLYIMGHRLYGIHYNIHGVLIFGRGINQ